MANPILLTDKVKKEYLAIGIPQWPDQPRKAIERTIRAYNLSDARRVCINTCDMSYAWQIIEKEGVQ